VSDNDGGQSQQPKQRCILDYDMFHYVVALCLSLPALYADDESPSADKQLLVATGRLNDLHALHLVFAAHVAQLLLTAFINIKPEGITRSNNRGKFVEHASRNTWNEALNDKIM